MVADTRDDEPINCQRTEPGMCPICGPIPAHELARFPMEKALGSDLYAVECSVCGHVYLSPRRSREYSRRLLAGLDSVPYFEKDRPLREFAANRYLENLERLMAPGRLLDVGCGSGIFLDVARTRGWTTYGTEFSASCASNLRERGHSVHEGELSDAAYEASSFDVITSFYVFEHLHDPLGMAQTMKSLLRPGGVAFVVVPNFAMPSTWWHRFRGTMNKAPIWDVPAHHHYFSAQTLQRLFRKAGFSGGASAGVRGNGLLWARPTWMRPFLARVLDAFSWLPVSSDVTGLFRA